MDVSLRKEVDKLFGPEDGARVPSVHIKQMLKTAWMGEMSSEALRPLCWRVLLGLLSSDKGEWVAQLDAQQEKYADLKVSHPLVLCACNPLCAALSADSACTNRFVMLTLPLKISSRLV